MELQIDTNTLSKSGDAIFGTIYFNDNDFTFPDKQWSDFVVVVLGWWCSGIFRLLDDQSISEDLSFMDGPFTLKIKYVEDCFFELVFIEQEDTVLEVFKSDINEFVTDFLQKVNSIIRELHMLKIKNEDVQQLEVNYTKLQKSFVVYQMKIS